MASTIKVDNVQNQPGTNIIDKCGTTITLGQSGDTIALACGASQTGFGRTGTVDWVTTPKVTGDSPVTAATGSGYFLNTTAGTITLNLPAGAAGSIVSMADYAATWQTNNVTVAPNGAEKIGGVATTATLSTEGQSVTFVYVDSTQGWVNTMDSTSNVRGAFKYVTATVSGACNTLTTSGDYKIAKFVGPGTFCVSCAGGACGSNTVDYMVVAGGGGSVCGGCGGAGGGGAGGWRASSGAASGCYTAGPAPLTGPVSGLAVPATGYPIAVGAGGTAGNPSPAVTVGGNSSFSSITSTGGGTSNNCTPTGPGGSGGGGASLGANSGGTGNTPSVSPPQGNDGGLGLASSPGPSASYRGGGGGGAGAVGTAGAFPGTAGAGGAGVTSHITASPVGYAGGGGGGAGNEGGGTPAAGGTANPVGGGGPGGTPGGTAGTAGTVNTGGGAGGGRYPSNTGSAAGGGSGIVVIRYKYQN